MIEFIVTDAGRAGAFDAAGKGLALEFTGLVWGTGKQQVPALVTETSLEAEAGRFHKDDLPEGAAFEGGKLSSGELKMIALIPPDPSLTKEVLISELALTAKDSEGKELVFALWRGKVAQAFISTEVAQRLDITLVLSSLPAGSITIVADNQPVVWRVEQLEGSAVRFDQDQGLTTVQKTQGRQNIARPLKNDTIFR